MDNSRNVKMRKLKIQLMKFIRNRFVTELFYDSRAVIAFKQNKYTRTFGEFINVIYFPLLSPCKSRGSL